MVTKIHHFRNGMVMAFDEYGKQVPEYQGKAEDVLDKLRRDYPDVSIRRLDYRTGEPW